MASGLLSIASGFIQTLVKPVNAIRAQVQQCEVPETQQGIIDECHSQVWLEVGTKTAVGRGHSCPSLSFYQKSTCGAGNVDELAQLNIHVLFSCPKLTN